MFEVLEYYYETLNVRLREEAFLNAGVRITLTDERKGKEQQESMCYEGGIRSFVEHIHAEQGLEVLHPDVIYLKGKLNDSVAEVAMQYNDSFKECIISFANNVNTPDGGTHEEGFKTALTRVFNDFGREKGYIKEKDDNLSGSDVREMCIRDRFMTTPPPSSTTNTGRRTSFWWTTFSSSAARNPRRKSFSTHSTRCTTPVSYTHLAILLAAVAIKSSVSTDTALLHSRSIRFSSMGTRLARLAASRIAMLMAATRHSSKKPCRAYSA